MTGFRIGGLILGCLTFALLPEAPNAYACTLAQDYVGPSNFELVALADAIVVATPVDSARSVKPSGGGDGLKFRTDIVLKGPAPADFKVAQAMFGKTEASDPLDLSSINPGANKGACGRYDFAMGRQYVVFLKKATDGSYEQVGLPYARVNEDYFGDDSAWVEAIKAYLDIQKSDLPMEQLRIVSERLHLDLSAPQTPLLRTQERDLAAELGSISQYKPTPFLIAAYNAKIQDEEIPFMPHAGMPAEARALADMYLPSPPGYAPTATELAADRESERRRILNYLLRRSKDQGVSELFERLLADKAASPSMLGAAMLYLANDGQYDRLFAMVEKTIPRLDALTKDEDEGLVSDISLAQAGGDLDDSVEATGGWRRDPASLTNWPEDALALYWHQFRRFGEVGPKNLDAIRTISLTDYRVRPLLTLALAGAGDERVVNWAVQQLSDQKTRKTWDERPDGGEPENPARLPLRILFQSYGDKQKDALHAEFCAGGVHREMVMDEWAAWGAHSFSLSAEGMASEPLSANHRDWLARSISSRSVDSLDFDVLTKLIRNQHVARPSYSDWQPCTLTKPISKTAHRHASPKARSSHPS